jgi:putative transcriptional regulator
MDEKIDESMLARDALARRIAGEVVMSDVPAKVIKKWRCLFGMMQKDIAYRMGVAPSVASDYESGRRSSPGIKVVRSYISTMLDIDEARGGNIIRTFTRTDSAGSVSKVILGIREFPGGVGLADFCGRIEAAPVTKVDNTKQVFGYTIIDSVRAVSELSSADLVKLYGLTTQRALIFTKVSTGRTPMVAIKLTNLRPGMVVLHGPASVDDVAKNIAEVEGIPLAVCRLRNEDEIVKRLREV